MADTDPVTTPLNRRRFVGATTAGVASLAGLSLAPSARGANDRVRLAVVGTRGRGQAHARGFAAIPGVEIAYICDVDEAAVRAGLATVKDQKAPAKGMKDFRKALDDKDLDGITIATPNHWHAPATIIACNAGKHVYVEKPCSHNPREGELMVEAARKHKRVVQMGNQRRSAPGIIEGIQLLREGALGHVYYSRSWYANTRGKTGGNAPAKLPAGLDFDLWQGPAPRIPYRENLVHYKWHWFWDWGNGELGNNGVHAIDLCRWGLGVDYPIAVTSAGGRFAFDDAQETPDTHVTTYTFEQGKTIMWEGLSCNRRGPEGNGFGASFHGEKGTMVLSSGGYTLYSATNREKKKGPSPGVGGKEHFQNFIDAIRGNAKLNSEIEEGHKTTLLCHLGNIAHRVGRSLKCDAGNGRIIGDDQASKLWSRDYEKGWEPKVI